MRWINVQCAARALRVSRIPACHALPDVLEYRAIGVEAARCKEQAHREINWEINAQPVAVWSK